jgi:hypothetical protein
MSKSCQLGLRFTVKPNCSDMSTRLAGVSVTRARVLDTCELSCVPETAKSFFISVVHSSLGAVGYVAASKLSSWGAMSGSRGSVGAHLDSDARSRAEEHVATTEVSS